MIGLNGLRLPDLYGEKLGALGASLRHLGIQFGPMPYWRGFEVLQWLLPSLLGLVLLPNLSAIFRLFKGTVVPLPVDSGAIGPAAALQRRLASAIVSRPSVFWFFAVTGFLVVALAMLTFKGSDAFIYFQF